MNDSLDTFEAQLRRLKPASPDADLRKRVAAAFSGRPASIPERLPAWRAWLERWMGPNPTLAWKFAAAAVILALASAVILIAKIELGPAASMGSIAPVIRFNGRAQGSTAAATVADPASELNLRFARAATESQVVFDEGLVHDESGALERRVRMQFIDTLEWRDSQTGAQVVVSYPREELFSTPVRAF
jgi:hypothetical protein